MSFRGVTEFLGNRNVTAVMVAKSLSMFVAWLWWPFKSLYILELGASKELLGLMLTVETFSGLFFQFPGGVLADRLGRKRVILAASLLSVVYPLIYLLASNWVHLVPALLLSSIGALSRPAVNALVAESLPDDRRGAGFAAISFVRRVPQIFTGILGGYLMDFFGVTSGVKLVLMGVIGTSLFSSLLYWGFLVETLEPSPIKRRTGGLGQLRELGSMPANVWCLTAVAGLSSFATRMAFGFTVIYAVEVIGLTKTEYGSISTVVSLISMFLTLPGGVLSDRIGKKTTVAISRVGASLSKIGVPLSSSFLHLAFFRVAGSFGSGLGGTFMRVRGGPVWQALVADATPAMERARMMGIMGTLISIFSTPASWAGGYIYDNVSPSLTFMTSFLLDTLGTAIFIIFLKLPRRSVRAASAS